MSTQPALDFVLINVSDVETSFRYFTETLGFETVVEENTPEFRFLTGAPGGIAFAIRQSDKERPAGQIELYFKTHDLEGLRAELVAKNVAASQIMHPPFGTVFTVPSPNGETLTMMAAE